VHCTSTPRLHQHGRDIPAPTAAPFRPDNIIPQLHSLVTMATAGGEGEKGPWTKETKVKFEKYDPPKQVQMG
jgi:hypothetical protein